MLFQRESDEQKLKFSIDNFRVQKLSNHFLDGRPILWPEGHLWKQKRICQYRKEDSGISMTGGKPANIFRNRFMK